MRYCAVLYLAVSIAGCFLFGSELVWKRNAGNILNAIHTSDVKNADREGHHMTGDSMKEEIEELETQLKHEAYCAGCD